MARPRSPFRSAAVVIAAALITIALGWCASAAEGSTSTAGVLSVSAVPWPSSVGQSTRITGTVVWHNIAGRTRYECSSWSLTVDGVTRSGTAATERTTSTRSTFSAVFVPPVGRGARAHTVQARCVVRNQLGYGLVGVGSVIASPTLTSQAASTAPVLPGTGGPSIWWLVLGLGSIGIGGGLVLRSRIISREPRPGRQPD